MEIGDIIRTLGASSLQSNWKEPLGVVTISTVWNYLLVDDKELGKQCSPLVKVATIIDYHMIITKGSWC